MKKLITTSLFILLFVSAFAQQPAMKRIDSMLVNIDKTTLTTNILYERTTPWSKLPIFNDSINVSTKGHFEQALHELYKASNQQKFTYFRDLQLSYTPKSQKSKVDIGIINTSFNQLNYVKDDEIKSALRVIDNKFEKITNTKQPFITKQALVIAPLKEIVEGNTISFNFNNAFIFEEGNKEIQSLVINFDTQTDYTVINNSNIIMNNVNVNYNTDGLKTLTFVATFTDGSTTATSAIIQVVFRNPPPPDNLRTEEDNIIADETFNGMSPAEIEYVIFYRKKNDNGTNNDQTTLQKPVIIIDGFDPGDERKIGWIGDNDDKTLIRLMNYENNAGDDLNLVTELRLKGYDVVIVNQITHTKNGISIDGGADYIERNAMAHVKLYQHLNTRLTNSGSSEELVIMGPSMGGQISRYALAYMEKENIDHNTRLWISVDSPHLGANIPVGQQALIKFFADIEDQAVAETSYYGKLRSVAGQQQLIEQYQQLNNSNPLRQQYLNNLTTNGLDNSNGYPMNLRKVAMANGSLLSRNIGIAGEQDFRIHVFMNWLFWDAKVSEMNTRYMPNTGGSTDVMYIWRQFKPTRKYSLTNNNPNGSMDIVPGGLFYTEEQTHSGIMGTAPYIPGGALMEIPLFLTGFWGDSFASRINKQKHSFVPTVSALGFIDPNFNWSNNINRNLVCDNNKEIPFDNFYAPQNNTDHVSFTQESINWLFQELDADPINGPFPTPSVYLRTDIYGDEIICSNETKTYSIDIPTCIGDVNWSVSPNLQITYEDYDTITIEKNSNNTLNFGHVDVNIPDLNITLSKNIMVGLPLDSNQLFIQKIGSYSFTSSRWTKFQVHSMDLFDDMQDKLTFQWQVPNSQVRNFTDTSFIDINPNSQGEINIGVRACNDCGCSEWKYQIFDVIPTSGGNNVGNLEIRRKL